MGPLLTVVACLVLLGLLWLAVNGSLADPQEDEECDDCFERERQPFDINDFRS